MTDRGPGWPTVLGLLLVVLTFSVIHPLQLLMVPLALLLVALPPRWPALLAFAGLLGALAFLGPRSSLWAVERGWTLLLGGYFILAVLVWPGRAFVLRAVAAVVATAATSAGVLALAGGWAEVDGTLEARYREVAAAMGRSWPAELRDAEAVVALASTVPSWLFPGFLAVGSVAALGVAWWGYRRLARQGVDLGRLTEFRFPDPWVWVLIAGVALLVLPVADWALRLGSNLVFFMGALYALRGLAVLVVLVLGAGPQLPVLLALGVMGVFLYPIVVAGMLLLGVTDTWLDLRSGGRTANDEG